MLGALVALFVLAVRVKVLFFAGVMSGKNVPVVQGRKIGTGVLNSIGLNLMWAVLR